MIYIIIGKDLKTHNEWVLSDTFENSVEAAEYCQKLNRAAFSGGEAVYRVDTVEPSEGKNATRLYADKLVAADRAEFKRRANDAYGKAKMDHEEGYPDSDSLRTKDFTVEELFTEPAEGDYIASPCKECGALVIDTGFHNYTATHVAWHNKLLP